MDRALENGHPRVGVTVLGSGSGGNSTVLHCGRDAVMIDAGFSYRETLRRMKEAGIDDLNINGILVTHEHTDHIGGIRLCSEKFEAPVYATRDCAVFIREKNPRIGQMALIAPNCEFSIGEFSICPFSIPHDAKDPVAFTISCHDFKIGVATDIGYVSAGVIYQLRGCNVLVIESNHDLNMLAASNRPWNLKQRIMGRQGHLSNDSTVQLLRQVIDERTSTIVLAHLSEECNTCEKALVSVRGLLDSMGRGDIALLAASQCDCIPTVWCT